MMHWIKWENDEMNTADSTEELSDDNDVAEFYRISKLYALS